MKDEELIDRLRQVLEVPPSPEPPSHEEMVEQLRRSAGNLGTNSPAVPAAWRGAENVGGGGEHCVILPRPSSARPPSGLPFYPPIEVPNED